MPSFNLGFISQAPVMIVVVGDPSKNGAEQFLNVPGHGYEHACAASIQNICLAAHCLGLGTLWLSLYEKEDTRQIFNISADKDPIGIVLLGYAAHVPGAPPRKELNDKVRYID